MNGEEKAGDPQPHPLYVGSPPAFPPCMLRAYDYYRSQQPKLRTRGFCWGVVLLAHALADGS